jgi:hypothetical protein
MKSDIEAVFLKLQVGTNLPLIKGALYRPPSSEREFINKNALDWWRSKPTRHEVEHGISTRKQRSRKHQHTVPGYDTGMLPGTTSKFLNTE